MPLSNPSKATSVPFTFALSLAVLSAVACGGGAESGEHHAQGNPSLDGADATASTAAVPDAQEPAGPFTTCSRRAVPAVAGPPELGAESVEIEGYYFEGLSRELDRSEELRRITGLSRVESCEQARLVTDAENELLDPSPGADDEREGEPLVEKLGGTAWPVRTRASLGILMPDGRRCTGSAIRRNVILTAGHCIAGLTSGEVGAWSHIPKYQSPGVVLPGEWVLRTIAGEIIGSPPGYSQATFHTHPNFTGGTDYRDDIGLIVLANNLTMPSNNDYALIWDEASHKNASPTYRLEGLGRETDADSYLAIWSNWDKPYDWKTNYIRMKYSGGASEPRICHGDSGGPLFHNDYASRQVVAGVSALMQVAHPTDMCAKVGGLEYWAATDHKASWIRSKVSCSQFAGTNGWVYTDCR